MLWHSKAYMCAGCLVKIAASTSYPPRDQRMLGFIADTRKQSFCPTCQGHVHRAGHPSLADGRPDLIRQLHPSLNPGLDPAAVTLGSNVKVTWLCTSCTCGAPHIWTTRICHRAVSGTGCPVCNGSPPCRCSSLAARRPDIAAQWHPTLNGSLQPTDVAISSNAKVHWQCHNHSPPGAWTARVEHRTLATCGTGCPVCARADGIRLRQPRGTLAEEDPELAQQWHPTLNGSLSPETVTSGSFKRVAWLCPGSSCQHPHVWMSTILDRTSRKRGCPFCAGKQVCPCNSLAARFPAIAAEWHPDLNSTSKISLPEQCPPSSHQYVWWQHLSADGAVHKWQAGVASRTALGSGCPQCAGRRCDATSLAAHKGVPYMPHPSCLIDGTCWGSENVCVA